ncbi:MAG: TaqI-like C-terminal specificity domain-containing protein [Candidatus Paceibacterota bacterium]
MNEAKFKILIENFSPALLAETFQKSHDFFRIKQNLILANKNEKITDIVQLGDFTLEDDTNILVVSAKTLSPLSERSGRKNQYDIAKKILKDNPRYNAGIFVYYDSKVDFRMSLIYAEYLGTKVDYSTFRRFTYFVSKEQKNITFIQQVSPFNFLNLAQLKELFSVEKVTKEFFKKYHDLFIKTLEDFEKNEVFQNTVVKTNISTSPDFVKKMMGQVVFLYFVQKKGWLGVRPNENWGSGDQAFLRTLFTVCEKSNKNYFNDYLEPLFYKALAEKRGDDDFFQELNCRIPFLNGGLFESIYDWQNTTIYIPNKTIGNLLDFFDQYNFTVDENTPSDQEISVDPEMLGKIFENLLEVKDRKDKGAFYTPREIVHYMCRESLIQHLVSENTAPEERIRKIFEIKDTDLSVLIDGDKKTETIKKMQELKDIADKVDISLRNVKIVDPAVGSGAFPMSMLNEISSVRFYLNSNFLHKLNISKKELSLYDIKKETLENCIYAVDIEPGAVEIAKLRFWLALVVEYESNDSNIAPPTLPNLDYKIMQGNSLLEEYEGVKLFDEKIIKTIGTDKEKQIDEIKEKQILIQKEYLNLNQKNELTLFKKAELDIEAKKLNEQLKKLTQVDKNDIEKLGLFDLNKHKESKLKADELKSLQKQFFETNNKDKKENIKKQIEKLEWALIEATLIEQDKTFELSKVQKFKKLNTKPFFLWKLQFANVFEQKGGFDIVIGNPPYVDSETMKKNDENIRDVYKNIYSSARGNWDLFVIFIEKGFQLLKNNGVISYIVPNKLVGASYTKELKKFLLTKNIIEIRDYSKVDVFKEVSVYPIVFIAENNSNRQNILLPSMESETKIKYQMTIKPETFYKDIYWDKYFLPYDQLGIILKLDLLNNISSLVKKIGDAATVSEAYEIKNSLIEFRDIKKGDFKKFINTGTIDPYISLWGKKKTQYIKQAYEKPVILDSEIKRLSENRFKQACSTKIIVAGMSERLECFYDEGNYIAGKSTIIILEDKENSLSLKYLLAVMNSKLLSFWYSNYYNSLKMAGGFFNVSSKELGLMPIKKLPPEKEKCFIDLVNKVLNITRNEDYLTSIEKKKEVKKLEYQIDELIYKLYDLSPEEVKIVENSTQK